MVSDQLVGLLSVVERDSAWRWICRTYLPDGIQCPACGAAITGKRAVAGFERGAEKTYCASCDKSFRSRSITPLVGTEWEPEEYVKLLLMMKMPLGVAEIAELLGKSKRCVRDMVERVRLQGLAVVNDPLAARSLQG